MQKDNLYFYTLTGVFVIVMTLLFKIFIKFTRLSAFHLLEACKQFITSLSGSLFHLFGTGVSAFVISVILTLIIKTMFSLLRHYHKTKALIKRSLSQSPAKLDRLLDKHNINPNRVMVTASTGLEAFSFGLLNPKIVISNKVIEKLNPQELEAVLLHELAHLRHHHPIKFLISRIVSAGLFFLPIIQALVDNFHLAAEYRADHYVKQSQHDSRHLKTALVKLAFNNKLLYPNFTSVLSPHWVSSKFKPQKQLLSAFIILCLLGLYFLPLHFHKKTDVSHVPLVSIEQGCHHSLKTQI